MSDISTTTWLPENGDNQTYETQRAIVWSQGEKLFLDGQPVVDTIRNTESNVQNIIWMNWEQITMDWKPVVNTLH